MRFLITGNPGIGKTLFGTCVLRLEKEAFVKNFTKPGEFVVSTLYMPTWDEDEIMDLNLSGRTKEGYQKKFLMCGGIPRTINIHWLVHIHINLPFNVNEELVEYTTNPNIYIQLPPYTQSTLYFASKYVGDEVLDYLEEQYHSLLWQFIQHPPLYPVEDALRGHLLESIAHKIVPKNCSVKI
ncbi:1980_t:CDS:2 [Entrophospora sp. SA101]|nr:9831_t:CDS:2 [Entrophospora sp. SA101]CAJ0751321.1 1980_t:CDS:2 [Entrophospora sp. SA101]CAJ0834796.1 4588_t:CDS:2 [Entrophospora sp. SA101]